MKHTAFTTGGELAFEADYVVVGTGAGGATAAVELARAGAEVLMVEAGPWRDPDDYPHSTYGSLRDCMEDWGSTIAMGRALWPVVQASVVGGSTVVNSAICLQTPPEIFGEWREKAGVADPAWAERVMVAEERIERELHAVESTPTALGRSNELALRGDAAGGFHGHVIRRFAKACEGKGQCLQGCRAGRKQSTNLNYVPEVLERGGGILSCAPVEKVLFEGDRAVGVSGRFRHPQTRAGGARFVARARKGVIVAASVTHTPVILRNSGIGGAMGEGFRGHPGTGVFGVYDEPVDSNRGVTQGWGTTSLRETERIKLETLAIPMEMAISRFAGGGRTFMERVVRYRHLAMWVHALRARAVGTVRPGFFGKPMVRYSLGEDDMRDFRRGLWRVAKLHVAAGARAVVPCIHGFPFELAAGEEDRILEAPLEPRRYVAILSHLFGGACMGADPSRAPCDGRGRVYGRRGLYVADASLFPDNIGVNPQLTIMGIAAVVARDAVAG